MANKKPAKKRAEKPVEQAPPVPPAPPPPPPLDTERHDPPPPGIFGEGSEGFGPGEQHGALDEGFSVFTGTDEEWHRRLQLHPSGTTTYTEEPIVLTPSGELHPWHNPLTFATDLERYALHSHGLSGDTDLIRKVAAFIRAAAGLAPATA